MKLSDYGIVPEHKDLAGIPARVTAVHRDRYEIVTDRRDAIFHAVQTAQAGDVIVLAGKGHEDYQIFENNRHTHFDEREIVAEALNVLA